MNGYIDASLIQAEVDLRERVLSYKGRALTPLEFLDFIEQVVKSRYFSLRRSDELYTDRIGFTVSFDVFDIHFNGANEDEPQDCFNFFVLIDPKELENNKNTKIFDEKEYQRINRERDKKMLKDKYGMSID